MTTRKHTVEVEVLDKGNYSQGDTLTYLADGIEFTATGEFYIDRQGVLHHTHVFDDGTEMDVAVPYFND